MKYIISKFLLIIISLCVISITLSCGGEKENNAQPQNQIDTTEIIQNEAEEPEEIVFMSLPYKNITILYPSDYPNSDKIPGMAKAVYSLLNSDCLLLNIPMPQNEITIRVFNGPGQFREYTGKELPYVSGDTLFNWPPIPIGLLVMEYLIPRWNQNESITPMYKHGLMMLMDGSGRRYHTKLFEFIDKDLYIPLDSLGKMQNFDCKTEAHQSALAASFVDFIMYYYGRKAFEKMYNSPVDFNTTVQGIYGISVDSLEKTWHNVIKNISKK